MRNSLRIVSLAILAMCLCGCLSPADVPTESTYMIKSLKPMTHHANRRSTTTILVSDPVANPGYQTANMLYMMTPYKLQTFSKNRWVASPSAMLLPNIVQALNNLGRFKAVVTTPFAGVTDYNLQTNLLEFEQNFMRPDSRFIIRLQASLVSSQTNKIIASRRFNIIVKAQANTPYGGVLAANKAVSQLMKQIGRFVYASTRG